MKNFTHSFMSCHWENLVYINYQIEPSVISKFLPNDVELDLFNGKAVVSFVCFEFSKAKILGIKIPFHQYFPEINIRTYVRSKKNGDIKGIFFLSEMVPKLMTYFVAKYIFGEPFSLRNLTIKNSKNELNYEIKDQFCEFKIEVKPLSITNRELTEEEHFVIEREFAFCGKAEKSSKLYQIKHQKWNLIELENTSFFIKKLNHIQQQLESVFLQKKPSSIFMTDGSLVNVFG